MIVKYWSFESVMIYDILSSNIIYIYIYIYIFKYARIFGHLEPFSKLNWCVVWIVWSDDELDIIDFMMIF